MGYESWALTGELQRKLEVYHNNFTQFGRFTVHCGDRWNNRNSKKEAKFSPPPGKTATAINTTGVLIKKNSIHTDMSNTFKYLGTIFTASLKDDLNIQQQII